MPAALWSARDIALTPETRLASLDIQPGLNWVLGGEGRGKTRLLQWLAGQCRLDAAHMVHQAALTIAFEDPLGPQLDHTIAQAWLDARREAHRGWQAGLATDLVAAFALDEHLSKPLYMLSAGSRRKLGLLATAASGAQLRLLDTPFAALDGRSRKVLIELLLEAAEDCQAAWVVADYALPAGWHAEAPASLISLGD